MFSKLIYIIGSEETNDRINKVYYNESGYGSIKRTHKAAREKDKSISIKCVSNWADKNVGKKGQPKGTTSFIAPNAFYEYQIDLCFFWFAESETEGGLHMYRCLQ